MSEHGTNAAYVAGCRCEECRGATRRYHKELTLDHHRGIRRRVDATGTRRRIEALAVLGWTGVQVGARIGMSGEHIRQVRNQRFVGRDVARRIEAVYGLLRHASPPENTSTERHNASRQRGLAARNGWHGPDAWYDIDDPDETPDPGWRPRTYRAAELVSEWHWLRSHGATKEAAARQLKVSVDAIEKAVKRAAINDVEVA